MNMASKFIQHDKVNSIMVAVVGLEHVEVVAGGGSGYVFISSVSPPSFTFPSVSFVSLSSTISSIHFSSFLLYTTDPQGSMCH